MKFLPLSLALLAVPAAALAGKVTNLDGRPHELTVEYIGGARETVTLAAGESAGFSGRSVDLILPGHALRQVSGSDEYIIKDATLYIQRRIDHNRGR